MVLKACALVGVLISGEYYLSGTIGPGTACLTSSRNVPGAKIQAEEIAFFLNVCRSVKVCRKEMAFCDDLRRCRYRFSVDDFEYILCMSQAWILGVSQAWILGVPRWMVSVSKGRNLSLCISSYPTNSRFRHRNLQTRMTPKSYFVRC